MSKYLQCVRDCSSEQEERSRVLKTLSRKQMEGVLQSGFTPPIFTEVVLEELNFGAFILQSIEHTMKIKKN